MRISILPSIVLTLAAMPLVVCAQQVQQAPATAKAAAPNDLTGYWVTLVTEDWLYRMVTPAKGDFSGVPLNPRAESSPMPGIREGRSRRRAMQGFRRACDHAHPWPSSYHLAG